MSLSPIYAFVFALLVFALLCMVAAVVVIAWIAVRAFGNAADRIMAMDWPSYAGYLMKQEGMIIPGGARFPWARETPKPEPVRPPDRPLVEREDYGPDADEQALPESEQAETVGVL